ncbi:MAG: TIGR00341 family protein [Candidatus Heimdallarchaeota archaeon]|nr:TIGR00341 family protein [Candidatus Heimdallarchaeota archaeon]
MKELHIQVPASQKEVIEDLLEQYLVIFSCVHLTNDNYLFLVKVAEDQTNHLLHELRARGTGELFGQISIFDLNLFLSPKETKATVKRSHAANVEEIVANIAGSAVLSGEYLSLVILSAILASFGLLSNSVVIIIGAMIVAPLLGPVALTSLGILVPGRGLFRKGITAEIVGILLTIAIGMLIGFIIRIEDSDVNFEMLSRAKDANALYTIIFAITSGLAAGLIISKGQSLSMVGVAIAASLAPPAADIGLFLALFDFQNAMLAGLLLFLNLLAINASCSLMFSIFRLAEKSGVSKRQSEKTTRNIVILTVIVIMLFFFVSIIYSNLLQT